jgi:hypothetical protein
LLSDGKFTNVESEDYFLKIQAKLWYLQLLGSLYKPQFPLSDQPKFGEAYIVSLYEYFFLPNYFSPYKILFFPNAIKQTSKYPYDRFKINKKTHQLKSSW